MLNGEMSIDTPLSNDLKLQVYIFQLAHSSSTSSVISTGDKEKESKMELTDRLVKGEQSTLPQNIHKLRVDL